MRPDIVSNENPINKFVFFIIAGILIAFQLYLYGGISDEQIDNAVYAISIIVPGVVTAFGFFIYKRYSGTHVFGKSYFLLTLAFLMIFLAEITYLIYDVVLNEDPYPSIADVFFFAFYVFIAYHIILNIRFFTPKLTIWYKIFLIGTSAGLIFSYFLLSFDLIEESTTDFILGLIFVISSAIVFALSILGAYVLRGGTVGKSWIVLAIGILSIMVGDIIYYYLELFGGYDLIHPVNLFWYGGYMVVIYALFKQKDAI